MSEERDVVLKPVLSQFKGAIVLVFPTDLSGEYTMTIGRTKAKAIVRWFKEIKAFADGAPENPAPKRTPTPAETAKPSSDEPIPF